MSSEMSGEAMQTRIATARRDAEGLKDKIKRKKDDLADTSRKYMPAMARRLDTPSLSRGGKNAEADIHSAGRGPK